MTLSPRSILAAILTLAIHPLGALIDRGAADVGDEEGLT